MIENGRGFPIELLSKSNEDKEEFFSNYTITHPKLLEVYSELNRSINNSGESDIILVIGPSGVGKSRVFEKMIENVYNEMLPTMELDKCIIPLAGIEVPNPETGKFNWKDFYFRVLDAVNEPLITEKVDVEKLLFKDIVSKKKISPYQPGTSPELRRSIENAFRYRKPRAFLIDEAQHIFKTSTGKGLNIQFDSIKSLANMTKTKFVLIGTYEMNEVINLSGQLSRRVKEIHFPRYDVLDSKDIKHFSSVLHTFQKIIPVEVEPDFISEFNFLYTFSVGCVGILKQWLERSLSYSLEKNEKTITLETLKRNALKPRKIDTLVNEAISGEQGFSFSMDVINSIEEKLGVRVEQQVKKKSGNSTPGKRKPERDTVGRNEADVG
ncbi:AAA family ATPase [Mesobacillus selenatarsenatis]|uniref:Ribonucleases G and E n=1 Tax=Mesobacillus selenatarsenatis (strain DSM 18680 / JCM 14380 / FERM P-15431 / SF-1) TaxID=1321606 RepID=A0A0A8X4S4_MESS1|nr:ATP-binding protein [Mesobacillus selenatarsenatis]GAM14269.1 ribonucleases G and E [Mesobacillus selenatarsenatis SF-1]